MNKSAVNTSVSLTESNWWISTTGGGSSGASVRSVIIVFNQIARDSFGTGLASPRSNMFTPKRNYSFTAACGITLGLLAFSGVAIAQDRDGDPQDRGYQDQDRGYQDQDRGYQQRDRSYQDQDRNAPARLRINPGTYITVRVNQWLSSDRNQQGEPFSASLAQPLIVDGVVVAQRGQMVGGRISEAQKAGRVQGTSRLGLELIDLTLADGQTVPIRSEMISRDGRTSEGRDAGAIAGTTALGAIIGAGAGDGRGAAIGAGAGAAAGILGVLLTRGQPTVVHPESVLTFRISAPVEIATDRAPQAFRYADSQDYERGGQEPARRPQVAYGPPPRPAYDPYNDDPYYRRPYYRPGVSVYFGSGGYWGPQYRGGFYYRGGRHR